MPCTSSATSCLTAIPGIRIEGDFPAVDATWAQIDDRRFDPMSMLDSGNEDDVLDAVVETFALDDDEWDWGAEHTEDDR